MAAQIFATNLSSFLLILHSIIIPCETLITKRGQRNKQGKMEKEANQLYRRLQMTGQARDEEEELKR